MINIRKSILAGAVITPLLLAGGLANGQTVNVGAAGNVGGMIVFVAQAKGFFAKNGIDAKVVTKPADIQRGLMYIHNPLPENTGMLFDFGHTKNQNMWMILLSKKTLLLNV